MSSIVDSSASAVEDDRNRQLAARYQLERSKRLNAKGNAQYIAIEGQFEDFARDPNVTDTITRSASVELVDVVIVGGGITGILTSVELRRAGIGSFRVIEKGADFGGTWYWNRYPGIACDCESLIYLPLLEEFDYTPSAKYVPGAEIAEHLRRIAEKYSLYENAYLQTQVSDIRWSDCDSRWVVTTDRGDQIRAKFVVLRSGPLHGPRCLASEVSTISSASSSTAADGITTTPAAALAVGSTGCATNASRWSEPGPAEFRSCRCWPEMPNICTSFSAPLRSLTAATMPPSKRAGRRARTLGGSGDG